MTNNHRIQISTGDDLNRARIRGGFWVLCFFTVVLFFSWYEKTISSSFRRENEFVEVDWKAQNNNHTSIFSIINTCNSTIAKNTNTLVKHIPAPYMTFHVYAMSLCQKSAKYICRLIPVLRQYASTVRLKLDFIGSGNAIMGFSESFGSKGVEGDAYILCQQQILSSSSFTTEGNIKFLDFLTCVYGSDNCNHNSVPNLYRLKTCISKQSSKKVFNDFKLCLKGYTVANLLKLSYDSSQAQKIKNAPTAYVSEGWTDYRFPLFDSGKNSVISSDDNDEIMKDGVTIENISKYTSYISKKYRRNGCNSQTTSESNSTEMKALICTASAEYASWNILQNIDSNISKSIKTSEEQNIKDRNIKAANFLKSFSLQQRDRACGTKGSNGDVCSFSFVIHPLSHIYYYIPLLCLIVFLYLLAVRVRKGYERLVRQYHRNDGATNSDRSTHNGIQLISLNEVMRILPPAVTVDIGRDDGRPSSRGLSKNDIKRLDTVTVANDSPYFLEKSTCSICMEIIQVGEELCKLKCRHNFHISCLSEWLQLKNECPSCRQPAITFSTAVADAIVDDSNETEVSNNIESIP